MIQKMRGKERYDICWEEKMSCKHYRVSMQHWSKVRLTYLLTSDRVYAALQIINQ